MDDDIKPVVITEAAFGDSDILTAEPMNKTAADFTEWKITLPGDGSIERTVRYLPHSGEKEKAEVRSQGQRGRKVHIG